MARPDYHRAAATTWLNAIALAWMLGMLASRDIDNHESRIELHSPLPHPKVELRPSTARLTVDIASFNRIHTGAVSITGERTEQFDRYVRLSNEATDDEIVLLTDHPNSVVRCYAFHALVNRRLPDMYPILLKHLADTTDSVSTLSGCLGQTMLVGEFMLSTVWPIGVHIGRYELDTRQRTEVDSILNSTPGTNQSMKSTLHMLTKRIEKMRRMDSLHQVTYHRIDDGWVFEYK